MVAAILGEGQIEIYKMSLGGLNVQSEANHTVGDVEVEISLEVAINIPVRVDVQGVGFFRLVLHETFSDAPCEGSLCIPRKTSVPIDFTGAVLRVPVLLV